RILLNSLKMLIFAIKNPKDYFVEILKDNIENELKSNFQVSEIKTLVKHNSEKSIFNIKNIVKIEIFKDNSLEVSFDEKKLLNNEFINRIMFFESPVYWKILS
ncbi:hypothetical protein ACTXMH_13015, partial [Psychrobacter celer]